MNKLIKIISISLISVFVLTGCPGTISENVTESDSDNITINLEEGYKFVDIKIGLDTRKNFLNNVYVYTLTKKRDTSEKPETYKLDMMYSHGPGTGAMPKHITIIEN